MIRLAIAPRRACAEAERSESLGEEFLAAWVTGTRVNRAVRIGLRIAVILAAAIFLAVGVQLWFFVSSQSLTTIQGLQGKALPLAELASRGASEALALDHRQGLQEVLDQALADPDVVFAGVYDPDGALVAGAGESLPGAAPVEAVFAPAVHHQGSLLRAEVPLVGRRTVNGALVLDLSLDAVNAARARMLLHGLLVSLLVVLGAVAIGLFYGATIGRRLAGIAREAEGVARGDLDQDGLRDAAGDEVGRIARAFDRLLANQRELVHQMRDTLLQLRAAAAQFLSTAQEQQRGSLEQSSAAEETSRTLSSLLAAASEIAQAAQGVTHNAERAHNNTAEMAHRIGELSRHVEHITAILDVVKGIASKSEVLALNAAIEGTRGGRVGIGFAQVASQMQRLAENVTEAVAAISQLTSPILEAMHSSVTAAEESIRLSNDTTRSAHQIELITEQQQSATEQVAITMHGVAEVAGQTATSSNEIVTSTTDVLTLCDQLRTLVDRYTSSEPAVAGGDA